MSCYFFCYRLYPFPTAKKNLQGREAWIKLINRQNEKFADRLWQPSKDIRVCSLHFIDGHPSAQNPYPSKQLGYNCERRLALMSPAGLKRKRKLNTDNMVNKCGKMRNTQQVSKQTISGDPVNDTEQMAKEFRQLLIEKIVISALVHAFHICFKTIVELMYNIMTLHKMFTQLKKPVEEKIKILQSELKEIQFELQELKKPKGLYTTLLTDKNCKFFTNLKNLSLFNHLHDYIAPHVKRRYYANAPEPTRQFLKTPTKIGPDRKLCSKDEFLLTLMKVRLGLLNTDLCYRFNISEGTCTNVFMSWIRAMAECLRPVIHIPDQGTTNVTAPKRFTQFRNIFTIIDCSEVFIETPKDLELQCATWSEYKHHNTIKFLVGVAPNSAITYVSPFYTGRISDKKLTMHCNFLDLVPMHSTIMADKGFDLMKECTARNIYFKVPPGRRGASQMTPVEVTETSSIAKVRILVEQVIRRIKTFRLLGAELPITLLNHADDILIVCCALSNFMDPIYKD